MENKSISINYQILLSDELNHTQKKIVNSSLSALKSSYSPYSKFKVGASVLLNNGKIVSASNQENISFPSGLCAERIALFSSGSSYPSNKILSLAISTEYNFKSDDIIITPCGGCRQVMIEYEKKQGTKIEVLIRNFNKKILKFESVEDLIPFSFDVDLSKNL